MMRIQTKLEKTKILNDTSAKMAAAHIAMLRQAGLGKRVKLVFSLSENTISLSRRAIGRKNTCLSKSELDILVIRYFYGQTLAEKLQNYLQDISSNKHE